MLFGWPLVAGSGSSSGGAIKLHETSLMPYPKIKCGCLGCGRQFKAQKDGRRALEPAIKHMQTCCPEKLDANGKVRLEKCWIGCKNCEVPGYVHETSKQRKQREQRENKTKGNELAKFFAMRDELIAKSGMDIPFSRERFGLGTEVCEIGGYVHADECEHNDTPVNFFRPDGDIEGMDIQWCLDNNFFEIHDGLWSGPWYYDYYPDERSMHRGRLQSTIKIRNMSHPGKQLLEQWEASSSSVKLNANAREFKPGM